MNAGFCSEAGRRARNDDVVGISPDGASVLQLAAVADGVSQGKAGGKAAAIAVREFMDAMQNLSPTAGIQRNASQAITAINGWLHSVSETDAGFRQARTTFTGVAMAGRDAHIAHVGDTRAWLLHEERLTLLTRDHTLQQPEQDHVLLRALGMEPQVRADFLVQALQPHDRLLLTSDGVHGVLSADRLRVLLLRRGSAQEDAGRIVESALDAGSQDNASCVVVDVLEVPEISTPELHDRLAHLPVLPPPDAGATVDGFELLERLSEGRYSRLLRARDKLSGALVVMKFPQLGVAPESTYHLAFIREAWVGARLHSPFIGQSIEVPPERQTRLYSVMPFYSGETLEARLERAPAVGFAEGIAIAQKLVKAIAVLHRAGIIHRDIKPENVLLESEGGVRLIDLGVVRLPKIEDFPAADIPGTPSYMAPELFEGKSGDEFSDQFALAVTLYRMWSARYPYGEIEPFSRPRFGTPAPLSRYRPDLPGWIGHVLARALQADPAQRHGDMLELSMEIDSGLARGEPRNLRRLSFYERDPLRFWKAVSALLLLALVASLALHA